MNNQPTRGDEFGCVPDDSQQGLRPAEILTTVLTVLAIALAFAAGVAAAAEWLRPEPLFPRRSGIPYCAGLAVGLVG